MKILDSTGQPFESKGESSRITAIEFGEPESVLSNNPAEYYGTFMHPQEYFQPPVSKIGLIKTRSANGFHSRMPVFRRDKLLNLYIKNPLITRLELGRVIENLLVTADAYIHVSYNAFGQVIQLKNLPSVHMRIKPTTADSQYKYCYVRNEQIKANYYDYEIIHLKQDDLLQEIYGIPEYFGAIQSILLNEAATLFRRKYYVNGAHLGSLFISSSSQLSLKDEKEIKNKIRKSKGVGNWRSMYLNLSGEHRKVDDMFKVIPVGDVAARDEFEKIKNMTDRDIGAAWGVRPEVAGIMPEAFGGTGDLDKLFLMDYDNKSLPLINLISDIINEFLKPNQHLTFKEIEKLGSEQ